MTEARETYLETQIATATPQKLRLMLIEGALRFVRQAEGALEGQDFDQAFESILRSRAIVSELIAGVRVDESDLARQVAAIYVFLFRTLTEAQAHRDPARLREVLQVLEEERQTWLEVCQQMPEPPDAALRQQFAPQEFTAKASSAPAFVGGFADAAPVSAGQFSIDA